MIITSLGMDPDVHTCAFALVVKGEGSCDLRVDVVRQPLYKGMEAAAALVRSPDFHAMIEETFPRIFVAEGQDARYAGRTSHANPQDLLPLAAISGAAICLSTAEKVYNPLPREWKGTIRKDIKQRRILDALGIQYEMHGGKEPYPVPIDYERFCSGKVNPGDWKDIVDAVGLALWGIEQYEKENRK